MKKVLILDLDNTIYPVKSVGDKLFAPLFDLFETEGGLSQNDLHQVKEEVMKRPFQKVAEQFKFDTELIKKGIELLKELTCDGLEMMPFDDYKYVEALPLDKFLVTTGFLKMQQSKIKALGIENDFKKVFIVDPEATEKTKKDFFEEILKQHHYKPEHVLVIGDDPESEINAARELMLDTFLFDPENQFPDATTTYKSKKLRDIKAIL